MKHTDGVEMYYARNRAAWRKWLQENHERKKAVWLVFKKLVNGKRSVTYEAAVEEALCFGWIDSKTNKLDEVRTLQYFARRNPKSSWSKINKQRIARLIDENAMSPAGLAAIEIAKLNGSWDALNDVEDLIIPEDLLAALKKNKKAHANFSAFPPSSIKVILDWIRTAKKTETRAKRIAETVRLAADNVRANHYRQPEK